MKRISAIIRDSRFDAVKEALASVGVYFFTYCEVRGLGLQRGEQIKYWGAIYVAIIYPIAGSWKWGGGFLNDLETPFYDYAGSNR